MSELIWACSAACWGWLISLAVAGRTFRGPQLSTCRIYVAALLCWAGSQASPRVSTFVILTSCLMAPQNRHKDWTVTRSTVTWWGTQPNLTPLNHHSWDPQKWRTKPWSCHTAHLHDPTQETLSGWLCKLLGTTMWRWHRTYCGMLRGSLGIEQKYFWMI